MAAGPGEAEEVIDNATAGGGDMDLAGLGVTLRDWNQPRLILTA
jgi:hypothetical protein